MSDDKLILLEYYFKLHHLQLTVSLHVIEKNVRNQLMNLKSNDLLQTFKCTSQTLKKKLCYLVKFISHQVKFKIKFLFSYNLVKTTTSMT